METRAESLRSKLVVEIVGKNEGRSMPEHRFGILRNGMEVKVPDRENRPDAAGEFRSAWRTRLRTHPFGPRSCFPRVPVDRREVFSGAISPMPGVGPSPSKSPSDT